MILKITDDGMSLYIYGKIIKNEKKDDNFCYF